MKARTPLAIAIAVAPFLIAALGASLWFFLDQPDHRIGGIAVNALIQFFAPVFTILYGLGVISACVARPALPRPGDLQWDPLHPPLWVLLFPQYSDDVGDMKP